MSSASLLDKATVSTRWNPKLACALTLSLVFLCGAAAGALVMDFGVHNRPGVTGFDTAQGKALYFDRLQKELSLTPTQAKEVQSILNDFWNFYQTVLSEGKGRIEQVLTAEQRLKFEQMLEHPR